jgi:hypothetical protein
MLDDELVIDIRRRDGFDYFESISNDRRPE